MPSPFRRKSGQIQPMSKQQLADSLAETEANAALDEGPDIVWITKNPQEGKPDNYTVKYSRDRYPETELNQWTREQADDFAQKMAKQYGVSYVGER